ncbi:MAG: Tripeptide aminopeptidase [Candidatus Carbobacillus altaicus]|uniref:Peptidase T n=1 Tax=Candidatus Carbonibacillus altaicus TaxID=2163959 RepID=A0A2R6XZV8_9BACL|nr:MAG: Tripeptide aminopeptidase [Candidatus Carbobacillus altaicus]
MLAQLLKDELSALGIQTVDIDENGYLMATLPAHPDAPPETPVIGFLAHLDTATEMMAENVSPKVTENYQGDDIVLTDAHAEAEGKAVVLSPRDFPALLQYKGHTLITTDGTTLLGADDKAGIAEIITAIEYLLHHPDIVHGTIRFAFTPDEEIGRGPHHFDVNRFAATYAYTVDGGPIGELQYESFNAAQATITIYGKNIHPGTAKGKMVHATKLALAFQATLPERESRSPKPTQISLCAGFGFGTVMSLI